MKELFSKEIESDGIFFKHARGKSSLSGKEFHTFHEILLILDGKVELITEKIHTFLERDTIVVIPKETYHQVIIHGDENDYERYVLNFEDSEFVKSELSDASIFHSDSKMEYLFEILKDKPDEIILKSCLALITKKIPENTEENYTPITSVIRAAIMYIEENIATTLRSENIARVLNVSVSTLEHTFKREMHIPLHRYIIKKRLIHARRMILDGQPTASVALELGFSDYSGFFKQYKKMFGISPSKTTE